MIWPHFHTLRIVTVFGLQSLLTRRRATHAVGVGAVGTIRVVDNPAFPDHDFFRPGREFPCRLRHANIQIDDDAGLDVRGAALKFSDDEAESPFDIPMNTGEASIFNDAVVFWHLIRAELPYILFRSYALLKRFYRRYPKAMVAEQGSVRRAPTSYTQLYYYNKLALAFRGKDGKLRAAKYRLVPDDRGVESGRPTQEDHAQPWIQERLRDEHRPPDYLRNELRARLDHGSVIYHLELQLNDAAHDPEALDSSIPWNQREHPWMALATVTLDRALTNDETERLRFSLANHPASLGTLPASSARDPNSVAELRRRAYGLIQKLRFLRPRARRPYTGQPVTVLTPVRRECVAGLRGYLEKVRAEPARIPFAGMPSLHFARFALIDASSGAEGGSFAPQLVYSAVVDGRPEDHLSQLVRAAPVELRAIYQHCTAGPSDEDGSDALLLYLTSHRIEKSALYVGAVGRSARQIRAEQRLRDRIQELADRRRGEWANSATADEIRAEIRRLAEGEADLPHGSDERSSVERLRRSVAWTKSVSMVAAPFLLAGAGIHATLLGFVPWFIEVPTVALALLGLISGLWLLGIRAHERLETPDRVPPDGQHVRDVVATEDHAIQNPMTLALEIKPGWFRWATLRVVLWIADFESRFRFNKGWLFGISTIHFARFYLIDYGRRMLFLSDYDGSWELYLEDFLSVGAMAVIPIWTNLQGCPGTRWLFKPEPGFGRLFKPFVRKHQVPTPVWYGAYDRVTKANLLNNAQIRQGLFAPLSTVEVRDWLGRL